MTHSTRLATAITDHSLSMAVFKSIHSPIDFTILCLTLLTGAFGPLVLAAASIANIVKSSLGPVGLDKMIVNEIGVGL